MNLPKISDKKTILFFLISIYLSHLLYFLFLTHQWTYENRTLWVSFFLYFLDGEKQIDKKTQSTTILFYVF